MASTKQEIISKDGTWKLIVEASSVNLFFNNALIASAKVYRKNSAPISFWDRLFGGSTDWRAFSADSISVGGFLTSRFAPGIRGPIPGSPDSHTNSSSAECRAWSVFIGVKIKLNADFGPTGGSPSADFDPTVDGIIASGSARVGAEMLHPNDAVLTQIFP